MKKALAMALGAVLVAGSAAPASAASQVDFSGFYGAHYSMNSNLGYTGDNNWNDNFFESRFQVGLTFQATDEVSVHWRFRAPSGDRWGNKEQNGHSKLDSRFYYGQVVQDWGTIRVGRLAGGLGDEFGLSTLGWAPSLDDQFTYMAPFEGSAEYDSIQYSNTWDNGFGLTATYSKITDYNDALNARGDAYTWDGEEGNDADRDRFQIQPTYQWDTGGVALNLIYDRDATANPGIVDDQEDVASIWYINPAFMQSWGAFSTHFEGMFAFGKATVTDINNTPSEDIDGDGMGFYLDFDYNYGPGRVNLAGWWVDGNDIADQTDSDPNNNNDVHNLADIVGGNFYPLVVAYGPVNAHYAGPVEDYRRSAVGAVGVANNGDSFVADAGIALNSVTALTIDATDNIFTDGGITNHIRGSFDETDNGQANHWALMISGQHAFTDEITFNYALAYLALNNPNYDVIEQATRTGGTWGNVRTTTQDKDLGWEIDLGVNVQLLDNLAFTSTFGYMFTGDAYKQLQGYRVTDDGAAGGDYSVRAEWEDADDAYSWLNSLTFSF